MPERRRHERGGAVYPLLDGRSVIGALVLVGQRAPAGDRIASLVAELGPRLAAAKAVHDAEQDRKSTRLNSSHLGISYAVFCLKKKKHKHTCRPAQPPP